MIQFDQPRLEALPKAFANSRVAVVGDLMLDRYMFGAVSRVSPEAPVPVVDISDEQARLGGAANVGHNIKGLGATPLMLGVVGDDSSGLLLRRILADLGFPLEGVLIDPERPTTVKTRVISGSQHMLRIDREVKHDVSETTERLIVGALQKEIADLDAIILEDYNKGVVTRTLIHSVIQLAREHSIPVLVDPKFHNFFEYKLSSVFKPNRKEVEDALGMRLHSDGDIHSAGHKLLDLLKAEHVLLTLGEKGMLLFEHGESEPYAIPTRARQVADVSGAGDTVIATMAVAMACGLSVRESALLANRAAGLVIEELGIVPIYEERLINAMIEDLSEEPA